MTQFVLVHGAWHGAWCWARVLPLLRAGGHAVTLTGVGELATGHDAMVSAPRKLAGALLACADGSPFVVTQHRDAT